MNNTSDMVENTTNSSSNSNTTVYTHRMIEKLADRISKIRNKDQLVHIFKIIYEDNQDISENNNGMFMIFNSLENKTYVMLDEYLNTISKTRKKKKPEKKEYRSYASATASCEESSEYQLDYSVDNKLKYSNAEKNIIKRKMYNDSCEPDSNVIYSDFDAEVTESETSDNLSRNRTKPTSDYASPNSAKSPNVTKTKTPTTSESSVMSTPEPSSPPKPLTPPEPSTSEPTKKTRRAPKKTVKK